MKQLDGKQPVDIQPLKNVHSQAQSPSQSKRDTDLNMVNVRQPFQEIQPVESNKENWIGPLDPNTFLTKGMSYLFIYNLFLPI